MAYVWLSDSVLLGYDTNFLCICICKAGCSLFWGVHDKNEQTRRVRERCQKSLQIWMQNGAIWGHLGFKIWWTLAVFVEIWNLGLASQCCVYTTWNWMLLCDTVCSFWYFHIGGYVVVKQESVDVWHMDPHSAIKDVIDNFVSHTDVPLEWQNARQILSLCR